MKYLFIVKDAGVSENANLNIAMTICEELKKSGIEINFFSIEHFVMQRTFIHRGVPVYSFGPSLSIGKMLKQYRESKSLFNLLHLFSALKDVFGVFRIAIRRVLGEKHIGFESFFAAYRIKQLVRKNRIDRVIAFSEPGISIHIVERFRRASVSLVLLDPYYCNALKEASHVEWRMKHEKRAHRNAHSVYLTKLIKEEYQNSNLSEYSFKWKVIEFPLIRQHHIFSESKLIKFPIDKINLLYCGILDFRYRDPTFTLKLLDRLSDRYLLHCVGRNCKEVIESISGIDKSKIRTYDAIPNDEIYTVMSSADILVNIGNNMKNQMPSKIIDYISTGKPILNIAKSRDCSSLSYTHRYPLSYDFFENESLSLQIVESIDFFCRMNKGKSVPYPEIEKLFNICTPSYVAEIIRNQDNEISV